MAAEPEKYFYPDQYNNDANWRAHYETTAMEIWRQTDGRITHFVTGLGTSGTFVGVTRRLKELNPAIQCISMQPDAPLHGLEGLKHMATALVPGIYDESLADEQIEVDTERCARNGPSTGAGGRISRRRILRGKSLRGDAGREPDRGQEKPGVVVTIFSDSAAKYLSESFWKDVKTEAEN